MCLHARTVLTRCKCAMATFQSWLSRRWPVNPVRGSFTFGILPSIRQSRNRQFSLRLRHLHSTSRSGNMETQLEDMVTKIHSTTTRAVFYVTGGAVSALSWLLSIPGASSTVLEASIPYAQKASDQLLGNRTTGSYSDVQQSTELAKAAYRRASELTEPGDCDFIGVAAACALATNRPKKGDHKCCISVHGHQGTKTFQAIFEKNLRSRREEDDLASQLLLRALAEECGLLSADETKMSMESLMNGRQDTLEIEIKQHLDPLDALLNGSVRCVEFVGDNVIADAPRRTVLVLPGSFNPLHDGHLVMMQKAKELTGLSGLFELSVVNPDKGVQDAETMKQRVMQFQSRGLPVLLTRASLFRDKALLLPGCTFVVGHDTAERIIQPKYYGNSEAATLSELNLISIQGCGFLVAGRVQQSDAGKEFRTLNDINVPDPLKHMFSGLDDFRLDISSTEIRNQSGGHQ